MKKHFTMNKPHTYVIDSKLVDIIISNMLFDPYDKAEQFITELEMKLFTKKTEDDFFTAKISNINMCRIRHWCLFCKSVIKFSECL